MSRLFDEISEGLTEAIAIAKGEAGPSTYRLHIPFSVDVKSIRRKAGMTQKQFAQLYGFALGTLRDWEQGRTRPGGVARSLLVIIDREPEAVERALAV